MKYYYQLRKGSGKQGLAMIKLLVHDALSELIGTSYEFLCKLRICTPKVLVMMDGGICSQMHQYLIGQIYAEQGEIVGYDLSFYEKNGMDVDNKFPRLFELEDMFPNIHVETFGKVENWFYRVFLKYSSLDQKLPVVKGKRLSPIFLAGYYQLDNQLFARQFCRLFHNTTMSDVPYLQFVSNKTIGAHTCAVHVRRGDLAGGDNPWYGGVTDDYFFRAIDFVERLHPGTKYFFFSDEMNYVEKNLAPKLFVDFELVKDPHKAYEDLILISRCETIIASQGSFGKVAAMLNDNSLLILQNDRFATPWLERKKNSMVV